MKRAVLYSPMAAGGASDAPSGERTILRHLERALVHAGCEAVMPCDLRVYDRAGDKAVQARLLEQAAREADRLIAQLRDRPPAAWVSYQVYWKSPDAIGPRVAGALAIPYLIVQGALSEAPKTLPWAGFMDVARNAMVRAAAIFVLNPRDEPALVRAGLKDRLRPLAPFLDAGLFPSGPRGIAAGRRLLAVGQMRAGDKHASYACLADALMRLRTREWTLSVAGDGPLEADIRALFAPFGPRVTFLGRVPPGEMAALYRAHDILVWPALGEAIFMAGLEAMASGCACVFGARPAIAAYAPSGTARIARAGDAGAFAAELSALLDDPAAASAMGTRAAAHVRALHTIEQAAATLSAALP